MPARPRLRRRAPLGARTTLAVGGPTAYAVRAARPAAALAALAWARRRGLPVLPVGQGSNLLVSDAGHRGLALHLADRRIGRTAQGLWAMAGASWEALVAAAGRLGLTGIECLAGIPGTAGAAPVQNIGAYGQEVGRVLAGVWAVPPGAARPAWLTPEACALAYRDSRFRREPGWLVLGIALRLGRGQVRPAHPEVAAALGATAPSPEAVARAVRRVRAGKAMLWPPPPGGPGTAGSFFVNPTVSPAAAAALAAATGGAAPAWPVAGGVKLSAAWLIERAGFRRGLRRGATGLSDAHALALVNRGDARARDVVALAAAIRRQVMARFGVALVPEVRLVGFGRAARASLGLSGEAPPPRRCARRPAPR